MANLQQFTNNAASTLNAGISSGATTIVLTSGGGSLFPALSGSQYFYGTLSNATNTVLEIVKVTARTTDTLTVVRAQEGTSASSFSTGDNFQLRVTAAGMNNLGQLDSANTWAQTQALNTSGNAATATKLAATKNIQGVAFDGSADITVATAGTGISVTGTSIANTGVLSVNGSTGAVTTGGYVLNNYTSPATWTKPAGLKAVKVTVVGAGGNGGPIVSTAPTGNASGGGGGGGGTAIYYAPASSISGPQSITAPASGTASFGAIVSATAGASASSAGGGTPISSGGSGGIGSGGTINVSGGSGGTNPASILPGGGSGGASTLSGGLAATTLGAGNGVSASGFGGGGTGASRTAPNGTAYTGGTGSPSIVIVEEFY